MINKLWIWIGAALIAAAAGGLGYAASHAQHGAMIDAKDYVFTEIRPGSPIGVSVRWGDPSKGAHGRLIKLPAGFDVPTHAHTGDYHGVNLTGNWRHVLLDGTEQVLSPGSYVFQPGGEMHDDSCIGPEDCILFLQQSVAADFNPKQ